MSKSYHCVYHKQDGGHFLVIIVYVNDMFFGNNKDLIHDLKSQNSVEFDMNDLGDSKYML
jgi:hypothetical protein